MQIDPYVELSYGVLDDGPIDFEDNPAIAELSAQISDSDSRSYPPQLRAIALNLWTFDAARNPRRVVELLKDRTGLDVAEQTIRRWALHDGWEERSASIHQAFANQSSFAVNASLTKGAVDAIGTLRDVMQHSESDSARVKAAMYVLGVAGYVPAMSGNTVNLAVNMGRSALAEATDEELHRQSMEYRPDDPDVESPPIEATYTEQRIAYQDHNKREAAHARYTHD